jgi:multidrug efflux pump subunit AcrB
MRADSQAVDIRNDWRSPVKLVTPVFNEQVGRQLGITREDLGDAMKYAYDGLPAGSYRDGNRVLPLKMRAAALERQDVEAMRDVQLWSAVLGRTVPASAVISGYETEWENALLRARNRIQTIIASCNPSGELATPLFERIRPQIEAIELPPGYTLAWGGEFEDNANAQAGLAQSLPVGILMMILTSILLFGKLRQPLIIWLTVPLAIVGVSAGLLATGGAFDFMSLLGGLSLIGLLIKNAIVLIEEIDQQIASGKDRYEAVLDSAVSRMRPVVLAAGTTILGLIPLLSDVFFVNMSVTIMAGLGFASLLTLTVVPTLYTVFFGIRRGEARGP